MVNNLFSRKNLLQIAPAVILYAFMSRHRTSHISRNYSWEVKKREPILIESKSQMAIKYCINTQWSLEVCKKGKISPKQHVKMRFLQ